MELQSLDLEAIGSVVSAEFPYILYGILWEVWKLNIFASRFHSINWVFLTCLIGDWCRSDERGKAKYLLEKDSSDSS